MKSTKRQNKYKKGTALTYQGVLDKIASQLERAEQYGKQRWYAIADIALHRAEELISLLEMHNCGKIGGFDKGQGLSVVTERYQWLVNHKPKNKRIK